MVDLTFYGGVGEIGGNKILLEADGTRIFLDFGQSFTFGAEFFTGFLSARTSRVGLRDFFTLDLIPKIPGLYDKLMLDPTDFPYQEPAFDGIFISHVHYDHVAHLGFADRHIPVYLGAVTKTMMQSWETTSRTMRFGPHDYHTFHTGDRITVGNLDVEPIHVDHSTPAAYGCIIYTPEGPVVYTGDLRTHGPYGELTRDFIEKACEVRPIAMICEGTRVAPVEKRVEFSEQEVWDYVANLLAIHPDKLFITTFYGRDIDRIKTYHTLAQQHGRRFVVSLKVAHMLRALQGDPSISVPDPITDPNMGIYMRDMKRYFFWEQPFLDECVDAQYIHEHQREIILHLDFTQFAELVDIRPDPGTVFVNSLSEPFQEEDIADQVKDNWLDFFHMERHQTHASGHAPMQEIFDIVNQINPGVVIPVHTEFPAMFADHVIPRVILPEKRQTISL